MTDEPTVSGQEAESVEEKTPTPTFSQPSDDSQKSAVDIKSLAAEVAELLQPTIEKNVQSVKDKRFADIEKKLGAIDPNTLEYLQSQNVDIPQSVIDDMREQRIRNLENQLAGQAPRPSQGKVVEVKAEDWSKVIDEEGLDAKNPEVIKFLRGEFRDLDDFELKAHRLAKSLKDNNPTPPEQKASGQGAAPPQALTDDQIKQETATLNMMYKQPTRFKKEIKELEAKLEPYLPK